MSYENLDEERLRKIADEFVIEVEDDESEESLRNKLSTLAVPEVLLSFPEYAELLEEDSDEADDDALITSDNTPQKPAKKSVTKKAAAKKVVAKKTAAPTKSKTVVTDDHTLIKMTRNNPIYEVRGYRFVRDSAPFVMVKNEDVDFLIEVEGGFTVAKPSEVESFYN